MSRGAIRGAITRIGGSGMPISLHSLELTEVGKIGQALSANFGVDLIAGRSARLEQASTNPNNYLKDKNAIIHAIVYGSLGNGKDAHSVADTTKLRVALPGRESLFIPPMSSLANEFIQTTTALTASGLPEEDARREALAHVRNLYNTRASFYDTAFPGLMDEAFNKKLSMQDGNRAFNQFASGL